MTEMLRSSRSSRATTAAAAQRRTWRAVIGAVVLGPFLAGCLLSEEPLFTDDAAETPFEAGRYDVAQIDEAGEEYESLDKMTLAVAGSRYAMVEDQQQQRIEFTLHPIGDGLLVAMSPSEGSFGYAMLRQDGDDIFGWAATCLVADRIGLVEKHQLEFDGMSCNFSNLEKMSEFMRDYAAAEKPDYRYRAIAE